MFAVLIAFAGALVAAVGAAMVLGRFIRSPRPDMAAWSAALAMLAISLGAQAMGFALGFGSGTFRTTELGTLLLGPLWLAWGLVEHASDSLPVRFGLRLATGALTVVPGVIVALDPLNTKQLGKTWPGQAPYMVLPQFVLILVPLVAIITAFVVTVLTGLAANRDPSLWELLTVVAAIAVAVLLLVSLRLPVPGAARPLLTALAAGLVWFAVTRAEPATSARPGGARAGRRRAPEPGRRRAPSQGRRPAWAGHGGQYTDDETGPLRALAARARPGSRHRGVGAFESPGDEDEDWPDRRRGSPDADMLGGLAPPAQSKLYGLIAIYTLLDGRADEFDRLAEETVRAVQQSEPGTLVYISHHVPNAPMQRIFYEVYRDRRAFNEHQRQPHIERFLAQRRPCVLATNVIELNLRHAKVSSLPVPGMQVADGPA